MKTKIKHFLSATTVFVCVVAVVACSSGTKSKMVGSKENPVMAFEMFMNYNLNPSMANGKYKDKVVTVSGKITGMSLDFVINKGYIDVYDGGDQEVVRCLFGKEHLNELANLKHDSVIVQGKCTGKAEGVISIVDCSLQ